MKAVAEAAACLWTSYFNNDIIVARAFKDWSGSAHYPPVAYLCVALQRRFCDDHQEMPASLPIFRHYHFWENIDLLLHVDNIHNCCVCLGCERILMKLYLATKRSMKFLRAT